MGRSALAAAVARAAAVTERGREDGGEQAPARAVRSPFCLTCLRTAPTGGEEGGEPAGAVCARSPRAGGVRAVAARWWATAHRAERGASEEHTGQCAVRDSQIAKSNKKNRIVILIPRLNPRTQILRRALLKERRRRRRPEARKRWQTAKSHKLITDYGHYELNS